MSDGDLMVSVLKDGQCWMFIYRDETRTEMLRHIGRLAADPETSFNWYDAAQVSQLIRNSVCQSVPSDGPAERDSTFGDCRGI
jgi:hypothetical protein